MSTRASMEGYEELGVEEIEFSAALDERTCPECGGMDGKHFPTKDGQIGLNMSPLHPHCRCTTIPYFDDEFTAGTERAARNEDGETYYVPSNMTYKQWKEKHVDRRAVNNPEFLSIKNQEKLSGDIKERFDREVSLIPESHRDIIKSAVNEVRLIDTGNSGYDRKQGVVYLRTDFIEGELVHEIGHAIETKLDLYHDDEFLSVLNNGLEDITPFDIIDDDSFVRTITRIENHKFVSEYQGFLYEFDIDGIERFNSEDFTFNLKCLGEYFSEGYRVYLTNPQILKDKDVGLYNFINKRLGSL